MADLFNIGLAGLRAQQAALAVTGHNITNAETPGYSRQRVELAPQVAGSQGGSFLGSGVRIAQVARLSDGFAVAQVRMDTSLFAELSTFHSQIGQIEGLLLNDNSGLDEALKGFFNAIQQASNDPSDSASRQMVLSEAERLSGRFQTLHRRFEEQRDSVANVVSTALVRVNELTVGIAELNTRIAGLQDTANGSGALNHMLDQRDEMLRELAKYVNVKVTEQPDGQVNVFIGKGQSIVLGGQSAELQQTPQGHVALRIDGQREPTRITEFLTGGEIGGALRFRDQVLDPAADQLGRLAFAVSMEVNRLHAGGVDQRGERGGDVFADLNAPELARGRAVADENNSGAPGVMSLTVDDPRQVPISDYELVFDRSGSGAFFIRRGSDGAVVSKGQLAGPLPQQVQFDHMTLTLESGDFRPGDVYHLQPLRGAAGAMDRVLDDPSLLALAGPLRTAESPTNLGTGTLELGEVFDPDHPLFGDDAAPPPLLVRFITPTRYEILDNSDPADPRPLDPPLSNLPYTPGQQNSLLPGPGATVVRFDGAQAGQLGSVTTEATLGGSPNGYPGQTFMVTQRDPATGEVLGQQSLTIDADSSARTIAAQLSTLRGVSATAETELSLSDLVDDGTGDGVGIAINGIDLGNVGSLNELADAINANDALTALGIQASSDGGTLRLRALNGDDLTVQVSGSAGDGVTVHDLDGNAVTLSSSGAGYETVTVGGVVSAWLTADAELSSPTSALMAADPEHRRADLGFQLFLTGRPEAGDSFTVEHNASGIGDNRNGLRLAELLSQPLLGQPPRSLIDDYANLVQSVGVLASQAEISRDAAGAMLEQSTNRRESVAGVNLDEEAANLIRFEQAYNAASQIISVARDTFNTLLSAVR
ncbi:MAG TPA: flagellar hook-associated protein FlgK [Pseudomonadales bacterium]